MLDDCLRTAQIALYTGAKPSTEVHQLPPSAQALFTVPSGRTASTLCGYDVLQFTEEGIEKEEVMVLGARRSMRGPPSERFQIAVVSCVYLQATCLFNWIPA